MRRVVFIQGGGIGLDQETAVRRLLAAAGVEIEWQVFPAGWEAQSQGLPALPPDLIAAVRETKIALKTKLLPPPPACRRLGQPANVNVQFRKAIGVFAVVRPDPQPARPAEPVHAASTSSSSARSPRTCTPPASTRSSPAWCRASRS